MGYIPFIVCQMNIAKEAFLSDVGLISNLKLRGSWGKAGNDKIADYAYSSSLTSNMNYTFGNALLVGTTAAGRPNADLKSEEITMTNIGLDLGLFNNQFTALLNII